jgi:hypothetical protein
MNRKLLTIAAGIAALVFASLACALPSSTSSPTAEPGQESQAATQPAAQDKSAPKNQPKATATPQPTATPEPTPTSAPALPIGMRQGLASLNSYHLRFSQVYEGPSAQEKVQILNESDYVSDGERSHTRFTNLASTKDDPSDKSTVTERYQIGSKVCSLPADDEKSPLSESNPMAEEMGGAVTGLMDISLYAENPSLLGEEDLNGVKTRHYQFKVTSLGKKSGAEVTQSGGEYWIAVDGLYLVKYQVTLETRSAPQDNSAAAVMRAVITYELSQINQPISIEMPAECN